MTARRFRLRMDGVVSRAMVGGVLVFLLAPVVVVVLASFDGGDPVAGRAFLNFPPSNLSLQWYFSIQPRLFHSLWISFLVACFAAGIGTVIGVPAALGLIRGNLPGKTVLSALFRAPLQIPFIVIGVAFLQTYYLLGDALGLRISGSFIALAVGHLFVATPYVIGAVGSVLLRFNPNLEEAALSLGASRWRAFRRVTLPIIMPGIYAGALFAFMVSFGDVPISLFLASPKYTTLPLEIFHSMEFDFDAAVLAISTLIVFASLVILWLIQKSVGLDVMLRSGGSG